MYKKFERQASIRPIEQARCTFFPTGNPMSDEWGKDGFMWKWDIKAESV